MTRWQRWRVRLVSIVLAGVAGSCTLIERRQPNIVVILMDTLRPDYLGFYGYEEENAPFLAELAQNAVVFDRAFSTSSWTAPSTSSLFTSLYPPQHGVIEGFLMHRTRSQRRAEAGVEILELNRLPSNVPTMPEVLQSMGYTTFGLAANINIGQEMGFDRGFDRFERDSEASADFFLRRITEWRDEILESQPYFLYLHLNDVHRPYRARLPYYKAKKGRVEGRRARYLSELAYADDHLRKIYDTLELAEGTVVVALSDHGEEFLDHGGLAHSDRLYIELNRVLMMIHAPSLELEPRRVALNVSLLDVLPTLIEVAGGSDETSLTGREGVSLFPALETSERTAELIKTLRRRILFAHRVSREESLEPLRSATLRHWKLIEDPGSSRELFNHRRDPTERRNLYTPHTDGIQAKLLEGLEQFKEMQTDAPSSQVEVEVDPELEEQLRSLGYVN